jgi:hypothetical protein
MGETPDGVYTAEFGISKLARFSKLVKPPVKRSRRSTWSGLYALPHSEKYVQVLAREGLGLVEILAEPLVTAKYERLALADGPA